MMNYKLWLIHLVDCQWSTWNSWSTCESGSQTRTRAELLSAVNGGQVCQGTNQETRSCNSDDSAGQFTKGTITNNLSGMCMKVTGGQIDSMIPCATAGEWEYLSRERFKAWVFCLNHFLSSLGQSWALKVKLEHRPSKKFDLDSWWASSFYYIKNPIFRPISKNRAKPESSQDPYQNFKL